MSIALNETLGSMSVESCLSEIDRQSRDCLEIAFTYYNIGPFGCFQVAPETQPTPTTTIQSVTAEDGALIEGAILGSEPAYNMLEDPPDPPLDLEDFFEFNLDPGLLDVDPFDSSNFFDPFQIDGSFYPLRRHEAGDSTPSGSRPPVIVIPQPPTDIPTADVSSSTPVGHDGTEVNNTDIMVDAEALLSHYDTQVAGQLVPIPFCFKCPWRTLNLTFAIDTLATIRCLGKSRVKHAGWANLYAVLACSAYHKGSNPTLNPLRDHWEDIALQSCRLSKLYLKNSLKSEFRGAGKAKYKYQMTAILSLLAFAVRTLAAKYPRE